jgi:hypothetical protein
MEFARESPHETIERRKPLEEAIISLFCKHGPVGWQMPALEFCVGWQPDSSRRTLTARAFDLQGDGEVDGAPDPLLQVAVQYHALCASFGEDWKKCLLTLEIDEQGGVRNVKTVAWNFQY